MACDLGLFRVEILEGTQPLSHSGQQHGDQEQQHSRHLREAVFAASPGFRVLGF